MKNNDTSRKILFSILLLISIASTGKASGVLRKVPGVSYGNALIAVSGPNMISDTVEVRISDIPNDYFIRLVDAAHPDKALDTIRLNTNQSMTVIMQLMFTRNPQWIEASGCWSLGQGSLITALPPPSLNSSWTIDPLDTGSAVLTVVCGQAMASVPIIVYKDAGAIRLTLSMHTSPDSCFAGKPIRFLVTIANMDGPISGMFNASILLHDTLDNSLFAPLPWFTYNRRPVADSLDKTTQVSITDGIDTVELFLFRISLNSDTLHQIQLTLTPQNGSGSLTAKTPPFMLRQDPAEIRRTGSCFTSDRYLTIIGACPETGVMKIRFSINGSHQIYICSCAGRCMYSTTVNGTETTIKLRYGVYIVQVRRSGSPVVYRQKLLVR
jgi:hypothetical protein